MALSNFGAVGEDFFIGIDCLSWLFGGLDCCDSVFDLFGREQIAHWNIAVGGVGSSALLEPRA